MPAARAAATSSAGVSPTWRASSGGAAGELAARARRSPGPAFAPDRSRGDDAVERARRARSAPGPRAARSPSSRRRRASGRSGASSASAGAASRKARKRIAAIIVSTDDLPPELAREHRGAAAAQLGERVRVAPLVAVLPVVAHLGAHARSPGARRARRRVRPPGAPRAAPARRGCRARRQHARHGCWSCGAFSRRNQPAAGAKGARMESTSGRVTDCASGRQASGDSHSDLISALITMARRDRDRVRRRPPGDRRAGARGRGEGARGHRSRAPPQTRLRLVRRLVFVAILVIGAALALSQFTKFERLATGILASSAVLGLVIGFAARQTLANMVAGILLAITQPIRIGDTVTIEDEHRPGRRPHALLHLHRHRRRAADGGPEREGRHRHPSSTTRPAIARRRRPSRCGCRRPPTSTQARRVLKPAGRRPR